jgi:hypothetical protein
MVLLAVTGTAATGSPNPVVWAERAGSTIQSVSHNPVEASPSPEPSHEAPHAVPAGGAQPSHGPENEASQTPEPKQSPEPKESPEPPDSREPSDPPIRFGDQTGHRVPPTPPAE